MNEPVTIAILCKNSAATLPLYLNCIYKQDYPRNLINLYVRTNDNTDNSEEILREWLDDVSGEYNNIYYDNSSVSEKLKEFSNHQWNSLRFAILGEIRQASIRYAQVLNTHYFVVDCDNFIKPNVLRTLVESKKPVIGPYLRESPTTTRYSNYHASTDPNGYFTDSPYYSEIWYRKKPGIHPVDVIHCTYLIRREILAEVSYLDETDRHEYVIFSHTLRKKNIQQYVDNRDIYGYLTFADNWQKFVETFRPEHMKEIQGE